MLWATIFRVRGKLEEFLISTPNIDTKRIRVTFFIAIIHILRSFTMVDQTILISIYLPYCPQLFSIMSRQFENLFCCRLGVHFLARARLVYFHYMSKMIYTIGQSKVVSIISETEKQKNENHSILEKAYAQKSPQIKDKNELTRDYFPEPCEGLSLELFFNYKNKLDFDIIAYDSLSLFLNLSNLLRFRKLLEDKHILKYQSTHTPDELIDLLSWTVEPLPEADAKLTTIEKSIQFLSQKMDTPFLWTSHCALRCWAFIDLVTPLLKQFFEFRVIKAEVIKTTGKEDHFAVMYFWPNFLKYEQAVLVCFSLCSSCI